jgi:hypothetical protein
MINLLPFSLLWSLVADGHPVWLNWLGMHTKGCINNLALLINEKFPSIASENILY